MGGRWDPLTTWICRIVSIPLFIFLLVQVGEGLATGVVMGLGDVDEITYAERPIAYWGTLTMWLIATLGEPWFIWYSWFRAPDE